MNRSPINGSVLGAGKNASFALMVLRQAHELVGRFALTVTKYLSFSQSHESSASIALGRRMAMGFTSIHEQTGEMALRLRKRLALSFLGRSEQEGTVKLSRARALAFVTTMENTATVDVSALHPVALAFEQSLVLDGAINLQDLYTGYAPANRRVGVGATERTTAVSGTDTSTGAT